MQFNQGKILDKLKLAARNTSSWRSTCSTTTTNWKFLTTALVQFLVTAFYKPILWYTTSRKDWEPLCKDWEFRFIADCKSSLKECKYCSWYTNLDRIVTDLNHLKCFSRISNLEGCLDYEKHSHYAWLIENYMYRTGVIAGESRSYFNLHSLWGNQGGEVYSCIPDSGAIRLQMKP